MKYVYSCRCMSMPKTCRHDADCAHQGLVCRPYTRGADSEQSRHHFTFTSR